MVHTETSIGSMRSGDEVAYHDFRQVAAGTRERAVVGTIAEGRVVEAHSLAVTTVTDPGGDLDVALFNGQEQVTPEERKATMATDELTLPASSVYDTGSDITVELDARDRNNAIEVTSVVTASVRDDGTSGTAD
jgi:hypothetical protein